MSDALPLPPRPNLDQYRKLAKDLKHACESNEPAAVREWASRWVRTLMRLGGSDITAEVEREINQEAARLERRWREWREKDEHANDCRLTSAQFFLAREHGFASWPTFAEHIEALTRNDSDVSNFERAADAIINGDARTFEKLLRDHPELVRERSTRDHRSTLLHYVSANGVEDFRQKSPKNIVDITRTLLDAGADVNATSDAYGGGSTTLGLVATSVHPQHAGVQIPLLELLIDRGSRLDQPSAAGNAQSVVNGCFANGQPGAARYLASRGAPVDLDAAGGLGDLAIVQNYFDEHGKLKSPANEQDMKSAFVNACGYGHEDVVRFLLERGIDPATDLEVRRSLPWAIYGGHVDIIKLLLQLGLPVSGRYEQQRITPLQLALGLWAKSDDTAEREIYDDIVRVLVDAGATLDPAWFKQDDPRWQEIAAKIRADARMLAALRGQTP